MKKDVLVFEKKKQAMASSRDIANSFEKQHKSVLRAITNLVAQNSAVKSMFYETTYIDNRGKSNREVVFNRDGFSLLVMGFTGEKALEWKIKYINAFNAMEKQLSEKATVEWQQQRAIGKLSRKAETDVLQKLIEYAKKQGSLNADKLYITYSSLVKKLVGYENRESATVRQLTNLTIMEEMILNCVKEAMQADIHYKEIYQLCKKKLHDYMILTYQSNNVLV